MLTSTNYLSYQLTQLSTTYLLFNYQLPNSSYQPEKSYP